MDESELTAIEEIAARAQRPTVPNRSTRAPGGGFATTPTSSTSASNRAPGSRSRTATWCTWSWTPRTDVSGLGARLLGDALGDRSGPWQAWSHGDHPAAAALARRTGFERVRELWVMRGRSPTRPPRPRRHPPTSTSARSSRATRRAAARQRRRVRPPPRAGFDGRRRSWPSGWPSRGSTPLTCSSRSSGAGCTASTGPSGTPRPWARCTSWRSTPLPRAGPRADAGRRSACDTCAPRPRRGPAVRRVRQRAGSHLYEKLGFTHAASDTHVMYERAARPLSESAS